MCKLGVHKWIYGVDWIQTKEGVVVVMVRMCKRCRIIEDIPPRLNAGKVETNG